MFVLENIVRTKIKFSIMYFCWTSFPQRILWPAIEITIICIIQPFSSHFQKRKKITCDNLGSSLLVIRNSREEKWIDLQCRLRGKKSFIYFFFSLAPVLKETLQLILRKFHKMRFFPWLSVFSLLRWKYKLSENNTILKLKITVFSHKLIVFCGLVNKYCCLLLSLSWLMRKKTYGLQREKRTVWRPRNITDPARN